MHGIALRRLAGTCGLVLVAAACSSARHGAGPSTTTSTSAAGHPTTSTSVATPSTTRPTPARPDPLAGAVVLAARDRQIDALDAGGHTMRTLVTVFAGRQVTNMQLM